jgi:hypothetical protein
VSPFLFPIAYLALDVEVAHAIETGQIVGSVVDETGVPVPGAEVSLAGADVAGERKVTTPEDGSFRFDGLPPNTYQIVVTFKGAVIARAEVRVALNTTTNVPIPAKMGGVSEEVEVVGYKPVVDTTTSAFSTSLGEDAIQNLPVGRSYQDVVNTIPGVSGRIDNQNGGPGNGNPSVRGEGQYGNNFLIDGVSTRDPATKTFGANVNFDAIQEIQVYTDGAPAEFGQFTGMVVDVVTKDGGDEHRGSVAAFYSQHAWFDKTYLIYSPDEGKEVETVKSKFRSPSLAMTAGGPIIKEKLWYFGSLDLSYDWSRPEGLQEEAPPIQAYDASVLAKVTWFANSQWTLRYIFSGDYNPQPTWDAGPLVAPAAASNRLDFYQSHRLTATFAPNDKNTLELRLGYLNQNLDFRPVSGDQTIPARQDLNGVLHDNAFDTDINDRDRLGGSLMYTLFLPNLAGSHKWKAGADYWFLKEVRDIQNTGETTVNWIDQSGNETGEQVAVGTRYLGNTLGGVDYPCTQPDYSDCAYMEQWTNVGPLGNTIRTASAFLQDDWAPIKQLTFNLGVRVDMEDGRNDEGDKPITQDPSEFNKPADQRTVGELSTRIMPAPRLGFALDPFNDGKSKVSGFYGQFYDLAGNNLWSWANARNADGFIRYRNDGTGNFVWNNTQDPTGNPLIYASTLKPARLDKINVGIEREVVKDLSVGLRGILSQTVDLPEDVDVNFNDWYIMNSPIKRRYYRGLELTANKWFDEVWQVLASVDIQESYGNTPGQFELAPGANAGSDGNNVGVYLDDLGQQDIRQDWYEGGSNCASNGLWISPLYGGDHGCGWVLSALQGLGHYSVTDPNYNDQAGWYGYLPYHSFVSAKLNGSYTAPFGTTFGLVYEFDSGHAWEKRTLVGFYGYDAFGQGRGSRFMPPVHYVDGRIAHKINLGSNDRSLEATLDIFNIPGFAQAITYWSNDQEGFGSTLNRQAPRSIRLGLKMRY